MHIVKDKDRERDRELDKEQDKVKARKLLGDRLTSYAKEKGFKFDDLVGGTGLTRSYISRIFNGHQTPSIETLYKLSKVLEFEIMDLATEIEYWVLSKGFESTGEDVDLDRYHAHLSARIELLEFKDRISEQSKKDPNLNKPSINISTELLMTNDSSMELLGINIDCNIAYNTTGTDLSSVVYSKLYVIKFKDRRKPIVRRIFVSDDTAIAIPYSNNVNFIPERIQPEAIEGIYEVLFIATIFQD